MSTAQILRIRAASRALVRELGFMRQTLAGTDLSPSAVHSLIETGLRPGLTAKDLAETLLLEKSTVSRMVKGLIGRGLLRDDRAPRDARRKPLRLTAAGEALLADIVRFAERQVETALAPLDDGRRTAVLSGLETYAEALRRARLSQAGEAGREEAVIAEGYRPGLLARLVALHAAYYSRTVGFGAAFESTVAKGLAEFVPRLDRPDNAVWSARLEGRIVGGIAIDGEDLGGGRAHLRWFILDDGARGLGLGHRLLGEALAFCDSRAFAETHLWTFKGLDAARHLYEKHGFVLAEEDLGRQWGKEVLEQRFVRRRGA